MTGLGTYFYKICNREYLKHLPFGLVLVNYIFQRIFRINAKVKFPVHYTSRVNGANNLIFNCDKVKTSLAVSGGCYFSCHSEKITIGNNTIFSNNVSIISANHDLKNKNKYIAKQIVIGENCWLGFGVVILPGVEIGDNVVVGANSVVTKSFKSNVVIAGNPAKLIREI